jgi:hypothetical protein
MPWNLEISLKHFCAVFLGGSKNDPSVVHFVELGTNLE